MDSDFALHRILKDSTRREILLGLNRNGSLSYMELVNLLGIKNTGRFNYHLKILDDLIEKGDDGKYRLTERGQLAIQFLEYTTEKVAKTDQPTKRHINVPKKFVIASILVMLLCSSFLLSLPFIKAFYEAPNVQWQQFLSGISGNSVIQTPEGGYSVLGTNASIQNTEYGLQYQNCVPLLVKTDPSGNLAWAKIYPIEGTETSLTRVIRTSDGGYALAGSRRVKNSSPQLPNMDITQFCLVKIDSQGNIQWTNTYVHGENEISNALSSFIQTSDGGYALVGQYVFQPPTDQHIWFVKADISGNLQWNKTISHGNYASSVLQTTDSGFLILGTKVTHGPSPAWFEIIKLNQDGDIEWSKTYSETDGAKSSSRCGIATADGGYLLAGASASTVSSPYRGWIIKTDSEGNILFNQIYGQNNSQILSVTQTSDEGYLFAGTTGGKDAWIVKTDVAGKMTGKAIFGVDYRYGVNQPNSIIEVDDGGYVLTGIWNGTDNVGHQKFWLLKLSSFNFIPSFVWPLIGTLAIVVAVAVEVIIVAKFFGKRN